MFSWHGPGSPDALLARVRKVVRTWPYGSLSGAIVGRRVLAHGSGLAGLLEPAFVGHVSAGSAGRVTLTGRVIPLPGGVLAELCAAALGLSLVRDSLWLGCAAWALLGVEMLVRYRVRWRPGMHEITERLRRAVEGHDDDPDHHARETEREQAAEAAM